MTDLNLVYRDDGPWGAGKGGNLDAGDQDNNIFALATAISALAGSAPSGAVGLQTISVSGTQMTFTLTDGSQFTFTLPVAGIAWRGAWQPETSYSQLNIFTVSNAGIFLVVLAHTSDTSFDPNFQVGGQNVYLQLFGSVDIKLSTLGDVTLTSLGDGQILQWRNFASSWVNVSLGDLAFQAKDAVDIEGGSISDVTLGLAEGTASTVPFLFTAGTNATTPVAGALEYDGVVEYFTPVANERGIVDAEQFITMQGGTRTLTSQTAAQKLFNAPTNGAITVGSHRTYRFECEFDLSSMSSSSGAFGFAFGGTATFDFLNWSSSGNKAAIATAAAPQATKNSNSAANTAIVTATTNTVGWAHISGILRVNAGGTIIPEVSLGVAAAAVVGQDSYFRMSPLGVDTVASVGNWS